MPQLSRGAANCLNRIRWYASQHTRVFPRQKKLAKGLKVGDRQLRRYLEELQGFCTDHCPDHCDGTKETNHLGLIDVRQGGDGRSALYVLTGALPRVNVQADVRPDVQADVQAETGPVVAQLSHDARVTDENVQAERRSSCSYSSSCISHHSDEQHYSPVVNNAATAKPSPERQKPNPKPASGGNAAFDAETAEIREALKARPWVRYDSGTFDRVIREMLAGGETVENIKRAILQGCWLKLACYDRGDRKPIISMRYFLNVIPDVKAKLDSGYWRNLERRLGHEEGKRSNSPKAAAAASTGRAYGLFCSGVR